jgi:hypothetical protein
MEVKIHLYAICWNEAKILPHFLRYYNEICEKIFIYDNFSTDRSLEIISGFSKAEIFSFYTNNQIRDDAYLKIKNEVWKKSRGKCDFVIVCDVDEFIYHPDINNFFKSLKEQNISLARCEGFNMITKNYPVEEDNIFIKIQEGVQATDFDKLIVFDPNLIDEINYTLGAHECMPIGKLKFNNYELKLLHYKYLSLPDVLSRYKEMGSRLSKYNKRLKLGRHYLFSSGRIKREFESIWKNRINVFNKIENRS